MRDASNTGYITLTKHQGNLTITSPGIYDGLDISGYVVVKAPNVTLRRCIVRGGPPVTQGGNAVISIVQGAAGFLVEDVTITPAYPNDRLNGINVNQPGTIRRCNISGTVDGVMIYGNGVTIEDSYLHDFATLPTTTQRDGKTHNDAIQIQAGSGIVIRRNTIKGGSTSAIIITQDAGTVGDLTIDDNDIDGGSASINIVTNGLPLSNIKIRRNHFGRGQRLAGKAILANAKHCVPDITGSVWAATGEPITVSKGG
jgi:hypothetical protein